MTTDRVSVGSLDVNACLGGEQSWVQGGSPHEAVCRDVSMKKKVPLVQQRSPPHTRPLAALPLCKADFTKPFSQRIYATVYNSAHALPSKRRPTCRRRQLSSCCLRGVKASCQLPLANCQLPAWLPATRPRGARPFHAGTPAADRRAAAAGGRWSGGRWGSTCPPAAASSSSPAAAASACRGKVWRRLLSDMHPLGGQLPSLKQPGAKAKFVTQAAAAHMKPAAAPTCPAGRPGLLPWQ